jgi:hypothetical protein
MSDFLEKLKSGMQEAQHKFAVAQQRFAAAQAESQACQQRLTVAQTEFQAAAQEFQAFQTLVNAQTRKEQVVSVPVSATISVRLPPAAPPAPAAAAAPALPASSTADQNAAAPQSTIEDNKAGASQTQAIRDLLRQHPTGMTPGEIWKLLAAKMSNRAYLYSVLKRLRDKGDARERRGKYFLVIKPEESQNQTILQ